MRLIGLAVAAFTLPLTLALVTSASGPNATTPQRAGGEADAVGQNQQNEGKDHDDDNPGACESQSVDKAGQRCAKALVRLFEQGKEIFRFDTFGDEDYWGGMLQLHKAVEGAALGGVGPGVSPKTALTVAA
jgi:hypothetical protein